MRYKATGLYLRRISVPAEAQCMSEAHTSKHTPDQTTCTLLPPCSLRARILPPRLWHLLPPTPPRHHCITRHIPRTITAPHLHRCRVATASAVALPCVHPYPSFHGKREAHRKNRQNLRRGPRRVPARRTLKPRSERSRRRWASGVCLTLRVPS